MSDFNPGPGWRELDIDEFLTVDIGPVLTLARFEGPVKRWVREVPVPPLPTSPYTVIRVKSTTGMESILIRNELGWYEIDDMSAPVEQPLTGWSFEVLAEPRAVTAKAVIDRLAEITAPENILTGGAYHATAREFGVES